MINKDIVLRDLKKIRKQEAKIFKVKDWVIFFDQSIEEMAIKSPCTMDDLKKISGVSNKQAEMHGLPIIEYFTQLKKIKYVEYGQCRIGI